MSATATLLVELFVEELPPKALARLSAAFADSIAASLRAQGLAPADATVRAHGTPRRLGVSIGSVAARAADREERQKLVPVKVGLDADGKATPVLLKKLASMGLDESALARTVRAMDGKNQTLYLDVTVSGASLGNALQAAFDEALAKLPIPKVMTYQLADGWSSVKFVRPAHGIVALHGSAVVPLTGLGLVSGRTTRGHRFESKHAVVEVRDADSYEAQLLDEGGVVTSFAARRAEIVRQLAERAPAGLSPVQDEDLLDEVTSLVENPNVLSCTFEEEFLAVPQECLILTMKQNQKYFPLLDTKGRLSNRFLLVSNIRPADVSAVVGGNERVVRPRLADARFFFEQDRKKSLESRVPGLAKVVYHNKLGTQGERVERVRTIARAIGKALGGDALAASADRAALLAKADLLTDMVGEFPELQGVMGGYYARNDREAEEVAQAVEDHYRPRFSGDALPRNQAGIAVALADKVETLVGLFGIGQVPTGDKDPFALRRHALGVIRMVTERELPLALDALVGMAVPAFGDRITDPRAALTDFVFDRLAFLAREQGFSAKEVDSVVSLRPQRLAEVPRRLAAVRAFAGLAEAVPLAEANKRIGNILRKSELPAGARTDTALLREPAEQALHKALEGAVARAMPLFAKGDFQAGLVALAALKAPVDAFFDAVMVNVDDAALRTNRLALLQQLHALMNQVADLSRLAQ